MFDSLLVRLFGFGATLHHGDPMVWDRWRWLRSRVRYTRNGERLLDVGCGSGAFTIGMAKRGYRALGLSWDERNQAVAQSRAAICRAAGAEFEICDVRRLGERNDLTGAFDLVICCENIEHVIDDFELMRSIAACLKPGGRLMLTTPYLRRIPQNFMDYGPFPEVEDGSHMRPGYNGAMLRELCDDAGLRVEEVSLLSGPISQLGAYILWKLRGIHPLLGWLAILPLRPFPPLLDPLLTKLSGAAPFSIGLEAYKPRLSHAR